jgi:hypothetical protein
VIVAVDDASDRGRLCLAELGRRAVTTVEVKPLGTAERRAIIDALPLIAAKLLEPPQVDRLLASDGARDPLFLRIALEELRRARSYAEVDRWIDGLPEGRDALAKLCERVVDGLVQDFGRELVGAVLGYLRCALRGLRVATRSRCSGDCVRIWKSSTMHSCCRTRHSTAPPKA